MRRHINDIDREEELSRCEIRLGDWMRTVWLPDHGQTVGIRTRAGYQTILDNHIATDPISETALSDINTDVLREFRQRLATKQGGHGEPVLAPKTRANILQLLKLALSYAIKVGLAPSDCLEQYKMPRWESPAVEVWNQQDIAQFLRYSEAESKVMHPLYLLAIATGMRRGELAGLQWNHVDLEDGSLRVEQSRVTVAGGTEMVSPKTDASRRMIRLSGVGLDALRSAAIFQQHQREALGSAWKETGFVFTGPDGLPPNPDRITKRFQKDSRRAGVRVIRFHDLRHTFASNALRHGVNPRDVCAILGHSKVETTMSIYVQFMPGAHEDAMAKINGILFGDRSES